MKALYTRRSIRKYEDRMVPEEKVERLIEAGFCAPSAGNQQPWHFIVIDDAEKLGAIPDIHPYASMAARAPLAILVCGDLGCEKHEGFWVQDCSAATQNILVAAEDEGLGAVWVGIYPRRERVEAFGDLFSLPEGIVPLALVPLGYPAEEKPPADRYRSDRVHRNVFGS